MHRQHRIFIPLHLILITRERERDGDEDGDGWVRKDIRVEQSKSAIPRMLTSQH